MTWLNLDLGEREDEDPALYGLADLVNLACDGHAGSPATIARSVERARAAGARIGAHPGYPDRAGFGRDPCGLAGLPLRAELARQLRVLARFTPIGHVKPHGALYHAADPAILDAVDEVVGCVPIIGPPALLALARARGFPTWTEGFADRGTDADGRLLPRGSPGAVDADPQRAADRARALAGRVDTICVHGDTPGAARVAAAVRAVLR